MGKVPFRPHLDYYDLENLLSSSHFSGKEIKNTSLYNKVQNLTDGLVPDFTEKSSRRWDSLYLPLREFGRRRTKPFCVRYDKRTFSMFFSHGSPLLILKGREEVNEDYVRMFDDISTLLDAIKTNGSHVLNVPYNERAGLIEGFHVLEDRLSNKEANKLKEKYQRHLETTQSPSGICLSDYLEVAAVCYKAIYGRKASGLSPRQMYQRWADGRDMKMLKVPPKSVERFREWYDGKERIGGHPFEIIFNKMHLYPPTKDRPSFQFALGHHQPEYPWNIREYVRVVDALIKSNVSFKIEDFEDKVRYLTGAIPFRVNDQDSEHDLPHVSYFGSRDDKKYFHKIKWDELKLPQFS